MRKNILLAVVVLIVALLLAEAGLRLAGKKPHQYRNYSLYSVPRNCYVPDTFLGSSLGFGNFNVVINEKLNYHATHVKAGDDVVRKIYDTLPGPGLPRVDFHGCSFTYGMGVSDTQTYPYYYAMLNPMVRVRNYGCPGYAALEALLILQRQVQQNNLPQTVIVNYLDFHDDRSAGSSQWREGQQEGFLMLGDKCLSADYIKKVDSCRFPFAALVNNKPGVQWYNVQQLYHRFWGRNYSALVYALEKTVNKWLYDNTPPQRITEAILIQIQQLCKQNNVKLIVTTMSAGSKTNTLAGFLDANHIQHINLAIDFSNPLYTNQPYDGHPSPLAHRLIAQKLLEADIGGK